MNGTYAVVAQETLPPASRSRCCGGGSLAGSGGRGRVPARVGQSPCREPRRREERPPTRMVLLGAVRRDLAQPVPAPHARGNGLVVLQPRVAASGLELRRFGSHDSGEGGAVLPHRRSGSSRLRAPVVAGCISWEGATTRVSALRHAIGGLAASVLSDPEYRAIADWVVIRKGRAVLVDVFLLVPDVKPRTRQRPVPTEEGIVGHAISRAN